MLLGLDFLTKHGATIDQVGTTMYLNGQIVPMAQEGGLVEARMANVCRSNCYHPTKLAGHGKVFFGKPNLGLVW